MSDIKAIEGKRKRIFAIVGRCLLGKGNAMSDIKAIEGKRKRVLISLVGLTIIFSIYVFGTPWGPSSPTQPGLIPVLFMATWMTVYIDYRIVSLRLDFERKLRGKEGSHDDTQE